MKFKITIEETIVEEFEIKAKNSEEAIEIANKKYRDGEMVLEQAECQFRQMAITSPNDKITEWIEF